MSRTMRAIRPHGFGSPEVLQDEGVPRPVAARGEVLVRMRAAGVDPPDRHLRDGYAAVPDFRPPVTRPVIPGSDVSGVVAAASPFEEAAYKSPPRETPGRGSHPGPRPGA